jgi:hypothetical protein
MFTLWRWECTLCRPVSRGGRFGPQAWEKIMSVSMPHHFRLRHQHHAWVLRNHGEFTGRA